MPWGMVSNACWPATWKGCPNLPPPSAWDAVSSPSSAGGWGALSLDFSSCLISLLHPPNQTTKCPQKWMKPIFSLGGLWILTLESIKSFNLALNEEEFFDTHPETAFQSLLKSQQSQLLSTRHLGKIWGKVFTDPGFQTLDFRDLDRVLIFPNKANLFLTLPNKDILKINRWVGGGSTIYNLRGWYFHLRKRTF